MLHQLKRHSIDIVATLRRTLVVTYAFPRELLEPLLSPGLELDTYGGLGFVAIAIVDIGELRPAVMPPLFGTEQRMAGYRIFARYRTREGRRLRGLKILRTDSDNTMMVAMGNLLTHYGYRHAQIEMQHASDRLHVEIVSSDGGGDLSLVAEIPGAAAGLPIGSPFRTMHDARLFAGPLPFTFDYEAATDSIIRVEGVRSAWSPMPVTVDVRAISFFDRTPFVGVTPQLANAFYMTRIPYRWKRGIREQI